MPSIDNLQNEEHLVKKSQEEEESPKLGLLQHIRRGIAAAKKLTTGQIIAVTVCVLMCVVGMSGQLITLNFFVGSFPKELNINVPFTILTLASSTQAVAYTVGFAVWVIAKKRSISFIFTKKAQVLGFANGWSIALNGVFIVSATAGTPEVIQAFLLSTSILWTFLFVKVIFGEKRSYNSPLIYVSFALSLGGIVVGSVSKFSGDQAMDASTAAWTGLFAFGMLPGAVNGVTSAKFMRHFTLDPEELARHDARQAGRLSTADDVIVPADLSAPVGTDENTVKFAVNSLGNIWQVITVFAMLPVGAIPWFGSSPNISSLGSGIVEGWKCTLNVSEGCGDTGIYFALFNFTFVLTTVGNTFLNYYSPAMTSMIQQLSSPMTALTLIIIPAWNVTGKKINIPESLAAVVLITIGSLCYTAWEESTRHADVIRAKSIRRSQRSERENSAQRYERDSSFAGGHGPSYGSAV